MTKFAEYMRAAVASGDEAMIEKYDGYHNDRMELLALAQLNATMAQAIALDRIVYTLEGRTTHA